MRENVERELPAKLWRTVRSGRARYEVRMQQRAKFFQPANRTLHPALKQELMNRTCDDPGARCQFEKRRRIGKGKRERFLYEEVDFICDGDCRYSQMRRWRRAYVRGNRMRSQHLLEIGGCERAILRCEALCAAKVFVNDSAHSSSNRMSGMRVPASHQAGAYDHRSRASA